MPGPAAGSVKPDGGAEHWLATELSGACGTDRHSFHRRALPSSACIGAGDILCCNERVISYVSAS